MAREPVFYSFHFSNDVFRVQQVRNMGVVAGDEPVSPNDWEILKRKGHAAVEKWIDDNMKYTRCVIVLIGSETASRPWVTFEIAKAWKEGRGLLGVYIHNLSCPRTGTCVMGSNPFDNWTVGGESMARRVKCYNPHGNDAYRDIATNLPTWVEAAIAEAKSRKYS
jgi:MTH538 TIR-like domain (DUF1863)